MSRFLDPKPDAVGKIAALWREETVTTMNWQKVDTPENEGLPEISGSRTRPFWVSCDFEGETLYAVAKPVDPAAHSKSALMKMTGHETPVMDKIAFDIAHDLGIPVAPAALWENGDGQKYVLSLKPFAETATLRDVMLDRGWDAMEDALLAHLPALSAVSVFNIFAAQVDDHRENMLLDRRNLNGRCAFIDYDTAFQKEVAQEGRPRAGGLVDFFENPAENKMYGSDHTLRAVDMAAVAATARKLSSLTIDHLADVVERIPDGFLPQQSRNRVMDFFDMSVRKFSVELEKRFGGIHADSRWPGVVFLSTRAEVPQDLKSALPMGPHLSDDEAGRIRNPRMAPQALGR